MKKAVLSLACLLLLGGQASADLKIVATLTEIGSLAEELGGDRVVVASLARGDEDPHSIAAKPSHSRRLSRADLLVYNGLELEIGWLPLLIEGARNPRILEDGSGHLDLSGHVTALEVPEQVDRSLGDVHPQGNPHFTLDPGLYPDLARALSAKLVKLDPAGRDYYDQRLASFLKRWEAKLGEWKQRLSFLSGLKVVAYHNQWAYAARCFDFQIVEHVENRPGIPPSPRHVLGLQKRIRSEEIPLLIYSDLICAEVPERFASRAGCKAVCLPQSVGSREDAGDLFAWFELWVSIMENSNRKE